MTALNHDILWSIFMLNASDQDFDDMTTIPLTTTIASSHVCRQWRQIILSSSQMWGRLFVVDGTYNRCCMEEVLTRSKVSPLWVYGYVVYGFMENYIEMDVTKEKERSAFFLQTVDRNWERVEVLTYQSAWEGAHRKTELTSLWKFMHRPAPLLRVFTGQPAWRGRRRSVCCSDKSPASKGSLFGLQSPLLHTFSTNTDLLHYHRYKFTDKLLTLIVSYSHHNFKQLLDCLRSTPSLRTLHLQAWDDTEIHGVLNLPDVPPVELPLLTRLNVTISLPSFTHFTATVNIPEQCDVSSAVLLWRQEYFQDKELIPNVKSMATIFGLHAQSGPSSLFLDLQHESLRVQTRARRQSDIVFMGPFNSSLCSDILDTILPVLKSPLFDSLTHLRLQIVGWESKDFNSRSSFQSFFSSLPSVTHLHIDHSPSLLNVLQDDELNIFPELHVLILDVNHLFDVMLSKSGRSGIRVFDGLVALLRYRRGVSLPINMVRIPSPHHLSAEVQDGLRTSLLEFQGLELIFEDDSTPSKVEHVW